MNITKAQSKKLRYICGAVEYNQPCTRKYTVTPDGKAREIGKFRYVEKDGKLESFSYGMFGYDLSRLTFDELLAVISNEARPPVEPSNREDAAATAVNTPPTPEYHFNALAENTVHVVDITCEAVNDKWVDPEDTSDWEEPNEMEKVNAARASSPAATEPDPQGPPVESEPPRYTPEEFEAALRETSMNAAAREAARLLHIECDIDDATAIIRANAGVPNFMETYGKCLEKAGTPHSLYEIAEAFPSQRKWLFALPIHFAEVKE